MLQMKHTQLISYLRILRTSPRQAKTIKEIAQLLPPEPGDKPYERKDWVRVAHHMDELADLGLVGSLEVNPRRYYLKEHDVVRQLLSTKAALSLMLTKGLMAPLDKEMDLPLLADVNLPTARVTPREAVIRHRIRVVPDGWERQPYRVNSEVVAAVVDAMEHRKQVRLAYRSVQTHRSDGPHQARTVTPLGLVLKETTVYLLAEERVPKRQGEYQITELNLASHRCLSAEVLTNAASLTADRFDIDQYLADHRNLCHLPPDEDLPAWLPDDGMFDMVLHVDHQAIFHFIERPFPDQKPLRKLPDNRFEVCARVPFSRQAEPFLWSHSPWVHVVEPQWLRERMQRRLTEALERYAEPSSHQAVDQP